MFLATVSKPKQLLYLSYVDHVSAEEVEQGRHDIVALMAELQSGFRLLADLSRLDTMDTRCAAEIGKIMELCEQHGVGLVVRVFPDPGKDIGLNILSRFHYRRRPGIVTCESLLEAAKILALGPSERPHDASGSGQPR